MATLTDNAPHRDMWLVDGQMSSEQSVAPSLTPGRTKVLVSRVENAIWATPGMSALMKATGFQSDNTKALVWGFGAAVLAAWLVPKNVFMQQLLGNTGLAFGIGYWGALSMGSYGQRPFMIGVVLAALSSAGVLSVNGLLFNRGGRDIEDSGKLPNYDASSSRIA